MLDDVGKAEVPICLFLCTSCSSGGANGARSSSSGGATGGSGKFLTISCLALLRNLAASSCTVEAGTTGTLGEDSPPAGRLVAPAAPLPPVTFAPDIVRGAASGGLGRDSKGKRCPPAGCLGDWACCCRTAFAAGSCVAGWASEVLPGDLADPVVRLALWYFLLRQFALAVSGDRFGAKDELRKSS